MKIISLFFTLTLWFFCGNAIALDCPKMPEQANKNWSPEVDAAVFKVGFVKGIELVARIHSTTTDLLKSLPDANVVYLQQMMYSSYCSAVKDNKSISDTEKASLIKTYNTEVSETINHQKSAPKSTSTEQKKSKSSDKNAQGLTGIEISGNKFERNGTAIEMPESTKAKINDNQFIENGKDIVIKK